MFYEMCCCLPAVDREHKEWRVELCVTFLHSRPTFPCPPVNWICTSSGACFLYWYLRCMSFLWLSLWRLFPLSLASDGCVWSLGKSLLLGGKDKDKVGHDEIVSIHDKELKSHTASSLNFCNQNKILLVLPSTTASFIVQYDHLCFFLDKNITMTKITQRKRQPSDFNVNVFTGVRVKQTRIESEPLCGSNI